MAQTVCAQVAGVRLGDGLASPKTAMRRAAPLVAGVGVVCLLLVLFTAADHWLEQLARDEASARAHDQVVLGLSGRVTLDDFHVPIAADRLADVQERLDPLLVEVIQPGSGILRVNLIGADGTIVYSDRAALRGSLLPMDDHHELAQALLGTISVERSSLDSEENRDLRGQYNSAFEVYVPVRMDGRIVGAYEIYQDTGLLRATELVLWLGVGAVLLVGILLARVLRDSRTAGRAQPVAPAPAPSNVAAEMARLTPRELQVLRLLPDHTTRAIANELVLSEETVRTHIKSILHKLKCSSRAGAVVAAVRSGLL
jgi:DNA-binding CsgD family transcriptional regulator